MGLANCDSYLSLQIHSIFLGKRLFAYPNLYLEYLVANDHPTLDPDTGCQTIMSKVECNAGCILKEKPRPSLAGLHTSSAFHITPKVYGCVCFGKIILAYSLNSESLLCKSQIHKLAVCSCCLLTEE